MCSVVVLINLGVDRVLKLCLHVQLPHFTLCGSGCGCGCGGVALMMNHCTVDSQLLQPLCESK